MSKREAIVFYNLGNAISSPLPYAIGHTEQLLYSEERVYEGVNTKRWEALGFILEWNPCLACSSSHVHFLETQNRHLT